VPKLHLLFNHTLTQEQIADAKSSLGIDEFIYLTTELQQNWSNVPPDLEGLSSYLSPIEAYLKETIRRGDFVLVQGDFGAAYMMVNLVKSIGAIALYATTSREVIEETDGDRVVKESIFKHGRLRKYE